MLSVAGLRRAILRADEAAERWWLFERPSESAVATRLSEVRELLAAAERHAGGGGWAVGYVAYEAAPAFDPDLPVGRASGRPLAAFAHFPPPREVASEELGAAGSARPAVVSGLAPAWSAAEHAAAVAAVRAAIARGETYQVNLTFPLRGKAEGDLAALFAELARASEAPYAAFLEGGEWAILSLSPELFFERSAKQLRMRPMKGTRPRGRFLEEDRRLAAELAAAAKDRAENLMIVDMARNDLGRVARAGTVATRSLFDLERYPTVWQMTSTVEAESTAGLPEIFDALFPCASVTGAPKRSTMQWIARLEPEGRGLYCGALGYVAPAGRARFSVAIRTAEIEPASGALRYGVGSGVVWDSEAGDEYRECLAKARALAPAPAPPGLFETLRWEPGAGFVRLDRHLARMAASAEYWGLPFAPAAARRRLEESVASAPPVVQRVRLELSRDGGLAVERQPFVPEAPWRAVLAAAPVDSADPLLFHKTTRREVYATALAAARARRADEAILRNERGELTEGTRANLVLEIGGSRLTPARECGLLAGAYRAELLDRGELREAVLRTADLARAERIWFVNSLRGWIPATLEPEG